MSGYQHLTPVSKESTHILIYNPVSGFTHIFDISDQFKNTYFELHITKEKFILNIIIYLILTIIPNTKAYQRSQYRIEHKSKDA